MRRLPSVQVTCLALLSSAPWRRALNKGNVDDLEVYIPSTRWPAVGQFACFFIGIVFFASFAYLNSPA